MRIRVLDLETTGLAPPAGVCEIGWTDVVANGVDLSGAPTGWRVEDGCSSILVDPEQPIPPETSAIHHIIYGDVDGAPTWDGAARVALLSPIGEPIAALAAHSAKFERQWLTDDLTAGLPWICSYKCALRLWPDLASHSNQAIRYARRPLGLNRTIANVAHRAGPDAYVSAFHVRDMLASAPLDDLIKWSSEPALQVYCHIGKQRGMRWRDVEYSFLRWVSERDFDEDVLFTVEHEMRRRREEHEAEERARQEADATLTPEDDGVPF